MLQLNSLPGKDEGDDNYTDFDDFFDENWEEKDNMNRKPVAGGTEVIATMTQKNGVDFPIAYASSIDLDNGDNLETVIESLQSGKGNEAISEDEIANLFK